MPMNDPLDNFENSIFAFFEDTGNNLSQFYSQSLSDKSTLLNAGQLYAYENLHKWMIKRLHEQGRQVTPPEILKYLQGKINVFDEGPSGGQGDGGSGHASKRKMAGGSRRASGVEMPPPPSANKAGQSKDNYIDLTSDNDGK